MSVRPARLPNASRPRAVEAEHRPGQPLGVVGRADGQRLDRLVQRERHRQRRDPVLLGEAVQLAVAAACSRARAAPTRCLLAGQPAASPTASPMKAPVILSPDMMSTSFRRFAGAFRSHHRPAPARPAINPPLSVPPAARAPSRADASSSATSSTCRPATAGRHLPVTGPIARRPSRPGTPRSPCPAPAMAPAMAPMVSASRPRLAAERHGRLDLAPAHQVGRERQRDGLGGHVRPGVVARPRRLVQRFDEVRSRCRLDGRSPPTASPPLSRPAAAPMTSRIRTMLRAVQESAGSTASAASTTSGGGRPSWRRPRPPRRPGRRVCPRPTG